MVLCFPVKYDKGMESRVYTHFGSAPMFITYNSATEKLDTISNQNQSHVHGQCSPIQALNGKVVDVVVVGGIGPGAINKLNTMGIKVFRANKDSIQNNIELFKNNALPEITFKDACQEHGGCGSKKSGQI